MTALIRFTNLQMTLGGRRILDVHELAIAEGQLTVLTGPNGAGKTTLLKIVAGLLQPDLGRVVFEGKTRTWRRAKHTLRRQMIYLHQHPYLFRTSVANNIAYGLKRAGVPRKEAKKRIEEALEWASLSQLAMQNARHLSGGEMQRLALCRARVLHPRLLLLDEPSSNMDQQHRERTYQLLESLRAEGISLVLTSHEPHAFAELEDQHLYLSEGRLQPRPEEYLRPTEWKSNVTHLRRSL